MSPFFSNYPPNGALTGLETLEAQQPQIVNMNFSLPLQADPNVAPWDPTQMKRDDARNFIVEEFDPSPQASSYSSSSSPRSPIIKLEADNKSESPIRKVKVGKIEKRKPEQQNKFVIVTPNSISAHAGNPRQYECFEAMRTTQRGRKGPLANETKENALQVRRLGACFCCHSRKVKCDKERPCTNCKKLIMQVPGIMCWRFPDFLPVLFPDFIRDHLKKDAMSKFISENVDGFRVNGAEQLCSVELSSGLRFSSKLVVKAKFFTAKTADVLQHWHMQVGRNQVDLHTRASAPIGIEMENSAQRDELRKKAREYIQAITNEPKYAEQMTESVRHTELPKKVLKIVQNYASHSDSPIVKRALSIYAMHYVLTRHLCLTRQTIDSLAGTKLVPQNDPWVTPRVLNRQIKAIIDELLLREMQQLFENFSKSLKPKSRREWAPCLAAFLVLCLFMEAVETAADNFAMSQNEINSRKHFQPEYGPTFAQEVCEKLEKEPFKQFAYQFHQVYLTHNKDASAKSFNPLIDDSIMQQGELDSAAMEMVMMLRDLIEGPNCEYPHPRSRQDRLGRLTFVHQGPSWTSSSRIRFSPHRSAIHTLGTCH
jgi:hypothetical protein